MGVALKISKVKACREKNNKREVCYVSMCSVALVFVESGASSLVPLFVLVLMVDWCLCYDKISKMTNLGGEHA